MCVHVCQACFLVMLADCSGENRARAAKARAMCCKWRGRDTNRVGKAKQANCRGIAKHIAITSGTQLQLSVSPYKQHGSLEVIIPPVTNTKYENVYTIVKIYNTIPIQFVYHSQNV